MKRNSLMNALIAIFTIVYVSIGKIIGWFIDFVVDSIQLIDDFFGSLKDKIFGGSGR